MFHSICQKAGIEVILPQDLDALCCGKPYASMGDKDLAKQKSLELELALKQLSEDGQIPIVFDASHVLSSLVHSSLGSLSSLIAVNLWQKRSWRNLSLTPSMNP
ncbi:D-lactate dehydrogenase [Vibrio ishigakensis]|uniref:D-lactate dehydrogenase n=1 Tax=Vibrio ishigakensis TaxID=1481914 RepID=A0A0B8NWB9_9VIBR|nr:D-lactate dehydrogenase [Vibrio ishigakensis]